MKVAHDPKIRIDGEAQSSAGDGPRQSLSLGTAPDGEQRAPIDWQALRARLFDAREQAALDQHETPERLRLRLRGSFDGCAASVLTTYEVTARSVNLDASAYGKPEEGKISPIADENTTGGRGQR